MRIKHTANEYYELRYAYRNESELLKDVQRWYLYKLYSSKAAAMAAIKRLRSSGDFVYEKSAYKITWYPYVWADQDKSVVVYNDWEVM